jgi:hypothetical protein
MPAGMGHAESNPCCPLGSLTARTSVRELSANRSSPEFSLHGRLARALSRSDLPATSELAHSPQMVVEFAGRASNYGGAGRPTAKGASKLWMTPATALDRNCGLAHRCA